MNLNTFFQLSVSFFCVVATIFMITIFIWAIMISTQFKQLVKKLDEILEIAKVTTTDAKNFTERTIQSLENLKKSIFTFEFIGRIINEVIDIVKKNKDGEQTKIK